MRVFIDSDVVISSLLSPNGAAYLLLHLSEVIRTITNISRSELLAVCKRLDIENKKLETLLDQQFESVELTDSKQIIKRKFAKYIIDPDDAHIVAGAKAAKAKYLITYNLKHYKKDVIKDELDILLMTPALFLQYLRSN